MVPLSLPDSIFTELFVLTDLHSYKTYGVKDADVHKLCKIHTKIVLNPSPYRIINSETTVFEAYVYHDNMTSSGYEIILLLLVFSINRNKLNNEAYTTNVKLYLYCILCVLFLQSILELSLHMTSSGCEIFNTNWVTKVYILNGSNYNLSWLLSVLFLLNSGLINQSTSVTSIYFHESCPSWENTSMITDWYTYLFLSNITTIPDLVVVLRKLLYG